MSYTCHVAINKRSHRRGSLTDECHVSCHAIHHILVPCSTPTSLTNSLPVGVQESKMAVIVRFTMTVRRLIPMRSIPIIFPGVPLFVRNNK